MNLNKDLFRYKLYFVSIILVLGYAYLHLMLTPVLDELTFDKWLDLSARLPFGQRLLVPTLAHYLNLSFSLNASECFFILELSFVGLFFLSLIALFKTACTQEQSWLLACLFLILLPLVTVLNQWTNLYYPYDTATLFFMTVGFLLCLKQRWTWLATWIFIATLNRESSILLVGLIPTIHSQQGKKILKPLGLSLLAYAAGRLLVFQLVHHLPGSWMEFYTRRGEHTNLSANLYWLFNQRNLLFFFSEFAGLPLLWFALHDFIPKQLRPIRYLVMVYFVALLMVGKISESRVLSEIVLLLYFPVCLAVKAWWTKEQPYDVATHQGFLFYCDRYAILILLMLIALFHPIIALKFTPIHNAVSFFSTPAGEKIIPNS